MLRRGRALRSPLLTGEVDGSPQGYSAFWEPRLGPVSAWELGEMSLQIHRCWVSKDEKFTKQKRKGRASQAQGLDE